MTNSILTLVKERIEGAPFPKLDSDTLQELIKRNYDVQEFSVQEFSPFFRETYLTYCADNKQNSSSQIKLKDQQGIKADEKNSYSFIAYRILQTRRNTDYGLELKDDKNENFIIFKRSLGFIFTDCAQMFLILKILEGVDEEDYKRKTNLYLNYTIYIKHYNESKSNE
jgi:hypothetical protein